MSEVAMHAYEPFLKKIVPWSLFLLATFLYVENLCPTISWRDSPEFVTVSHNLDISHPAGSPTYSLASKLLTFVPIGNIALRVNLFSSISASMSIVLMFTLLYQILNQQASLQRIAAATGGSLLLLSCQSFWMFSSIAEVYTFQNLFLILLLIVITKAYSKPTLLNVRYQYIFVFLFGLSLGVHASMAIFIPSFFAYMLLHGTNTFKLKNIAFLAFFSILGFLVYMFLPLRSVSQLAFDWGDPETFHQFLNQIFDQKDSKVEIYSLGGFSIFKFKIYIENILSEFSIMLCLIGIVGFFRLVIYQIRLAVVLFLVFISNIIFFLNAGWTVSWGYIPSFVIFAIFFGNGISFLSSMISSLSLSKFNLNIPKYISIVSAVAILLIIGNLIKNNRNLATNKDYSAKFFGEKILSELPADAILFSEYLWFPLLYLQQVEHRRPDLTIILQGELFFPNYFETISKARFPNINHIDMPYDNHTAYEYLWKLAQANAVDRFLFWEPDGQFQEWLIDHLTPHGMLFLFDPYQKNMIAKSDMDQANSYLQQLRTQDIKFLNNSEGKHYIANKLNYLANFWATLQNENMELNFFETAIEIYPEGKTLNNNYGMYFMSKDELSQAYNYLNKSYHASPYNLPAYKNLANVMFRINNYQAALYFLKTFNHFSKRKDRDVESLLGAVYYELGQCDQAIRSLETSWKLTQDELQTETDHAKHEKAVNWIKLYREFCFENMIGLSSSNKPS